LAASAGGKTRAKHDCSDASQALEAENLAEFHGKSEEIFFKKTLAGSTHVDILAVFLRMRRKDCTTRITNVDSRRRLQ